MTALVQKLGGKCAALELLAVWVTEQGCCYCSVMDRISRSCGSYFSTPSKSDCVLRTDQNRVVTYIFICSAMHHAGVRYTLSTAYHAQVFWNSCFQGFMDRAFVPFWWTPKAFKGKGQALVQWIALVASALFCVSRSLV